MAISKEQINLEVSINGKKAGKTLANLQGEYKRLNNQVRLLPVGTKKFIEASKKLQKVKARMIEVRESIQGTGGALNKIKKQLGPLGATVIAAFGVNKIISFGKEIIGLADIQAKAEKSLEVALGKVSRALLDQASALQKRTIFGDEAIIGGQAFLAQMGLEEDQIERLTPAILDFAAAKGIDLKTAFDLVAKSTGSSTNALSRYGIEITGAVGSEERLNTAIENLNKAFGGQAEAATVGAGGLQQFSNLVGDLQEKMGALLIKGLNPIVKQFGKFITSISETVFPSKKLSETLLEEQIRLNLLVMRITDANNSQEKRNKLIGQLQKDYPDFLKNLDAEKVSNEQLAGRLKEVNEQLVNKIIIQRKSEEIGEQAENTATRLEDKLKAEKILNEKLLESNNALRESIDFTNLSQEDRIRLVKEALGAEALFVKAEKGRVIAGNDQAVLLVKLRQLNADFENSTRKFNDANNEGNLLLLEKNELLKILGITEEKAAEKTAERTEAENEASDKNADELIEKHQALQERINALNEEQNLKQLEDDEIEIERIRLKFERIMEEAKLNEQTKQEFENEIRELEAIRDAEIEAKEEEQRLRKENERKQEEKNIKAFQDKINLLKVNANTREIKAIEQKYANLIKQAKQFNLDITGLEKLRDQEINALIIKQNEQEFQLQQQQNASKLAEQQKNFAASAQIVADFGSISTSMMLLLGAEESEFAEFQKVITLVQIAIDTASAISSLIAASNANPANIPTGGIAGVVQFTAGLARILANIVKAKQLLTTPVPKYAEGGTTVASGGKIKKPTLAEFGEQGTEWVAPNWMLQSPLYADTIKMLEYARQSRIGKYQEGGPTITTSPITAPATLPAAQRFTEEELNVQIQLTAAIEKLSDKLDQPIRAFFTPDEIEDINEFNETLDQIKDEANIG